MSKALDILYDELVMKKFEFDSLNGLYVENSKKFDDLDNFKSIHSLTDADLDLMIHTGIDYVVTLFNLVQGKTNYLHKELIPELLGQLKQTEPIFLKTKNELSDYYKLQKANAMLKDKIKGEMLKFKNETSFYLNIIEDQSINHTSILKKISHYDTIGAENKKILNKINTGISKNQKLRSQIHKFPNINGIMKRTDDLHELDVIIYELKSQLKDRGISMENVEDRHEIFQEKIDLMKQVERWKIRVQSLEETIARNS